MYFCSIIDHPDGKEYDLVSNSEFIIKRTANLQSVSKYYINNKLSDFGQITDFLISKGIDLNNNRFLILQGEVEQISLMKPKVLITTKIRVKMV